MPLKSPESFLTLFENSREPREQPGSSPGSSNVLNFAVCTTKMWKTDQVRGQERFLAFQGIFGRFRRRFSAFQMTFRSTSGNFKRILEVTATVLVLPESPWNDAQKLWTLLKTSSKNMEPPEASWNALKLLWNCPEAPWNPLNFPEFPENNWDTLKRPATSWISLRYLEMLQSRGLLNFVKTS